VLKKQENEDVLGK